MSLGPGFSDRSGIVQTGIRRRFGPAASAAAKVLVIAGFFLVCSILYGLINEWAYHSPRTWYFRGPREDLPGVIQPWTAVIYVFGGYAAPLIPFIYNWSWPRLRFVLLSYALSSLIMFAIFLGVPVGMHRPEYAGASLGERLMLGVFAVDRETNCFPSGHTVFAILPALLVAHAGAPRWAGVGTWALSVAIAITTVTTGQHYYQDVAAGVLTAFAGFGLARRIDPQPSLRCP